MTVTGDNPLLGVRAIMEALVLDEYKWAKVPSQDTQAVLIDMEDTVAQLRKLEGRAAVIEALGKPEYVGDQLILARPNALDTEWGQDDTTALAEAKAEYVLLPMATCAADVKAYQEIFHRHDVDPVLIPAIETPGGVGSVEEISQIAGVGGFAFGEGDLTAQMGIDIFEPDGSINPVVTAARARVYTAASAAKCAMFDIAFLKDLKDLVEFERRCSELARMGATAFFALFPPHVPVINRIFQPTDEQLEYARVVVAAFDQAAAEGKPAVQLASGKALLIHDYTKAQRLLERAGSA
jgi:citrate lyase subunit beta / citryl-CoA lyase